MKDVDGYPLIASQNQKHIISFTSFSTAETYNILDYMRPVPLDDTLEEISENGMKTIKRLETKSKTVIYPNNAPRYPSDGRQ